MKKIFCGKRAKMLIAIFMVLVMMVPMSAMAWSENGKHTVGGPNGNPVLNISLTKETTFFGTNYYGCFLAKQFLYDSSLKMDKYITTINTQCYYADLNKSYTSTSNYTNSGVARTKQVYNGYDDTTIVSFGLVFEYQSYAFGNGVIRRTVPIDKT